MRNRIKKQLNILLSGKIIILLLNNRCFLINGVNIKKYLISVSVVSAFSVEVNADDDSIAKEIALEFHFEDFLRPRDYDLGVLEIEEIK